VPPKVSLILSNKNHLYVISFSITRIDRCRRYPMVDQ
jgi:hypothetical protein